MNLNIIAPDWDNILPKIFTDTRFHQTGRSRYQVNIDGTRAGVVVAWRTANFANHALNVSDFEKLIELKHENKFDAAFVVAANAPSKYSGYGRIVMPKNFRRRPCLWKVPSAPSGFFRPSTSAILTSTLTTFHTEQLSFSLARRRIDVRSQRTTRHASQLLDLHHVLRWYLHPMCDCGVAYGQLWQRLVAVVALGLSHTL